jgi:two-component system, sensor histidine kinase and response regulator
MTLNRQSNILAWLATIAVIVVIITTRFFIVEVRKQAEQITMAENVVKGVSHFRFLIMETTLYNEQRSLEQWQAHTKSFSTMLAAQHYSTAAENTLLVKEKNNLNVLINLYGRLTNLRSNANVPFYATETQDRTTITASALFLTTQDMLDNAFELVNLNRIDLARAQNQAAIFMQISIVVLTILIAAGCFIIKRRVLVPVATLRLGTERVAKGDLGFRLNLSTYNEIGILANTFDRMTEELEKAQNATQKTVQMLANKTVELTNFQQELQTIIDHMPALVGSWDTNLCNRFGNKAYIDWFGVTPQQMHGKHMREIIGNERFVQLEPHLKLVLRGTPLAFERTIQYANGSIRDAVFSYVPDIENGIVKGLYGFVSDVTPLKQAQMGKEKVLMQLQDIVDAAKDFAIIETDEHGLVTLFSRGAEILLGYSAEEIIGKANATRFHIHEEVVARGEALSLQLGRPIYGFDALVELARRGESESREWSYVHKDGTTLAINLTVTTIRNKEGVITGYLGIAKDIREHKRNLQALAETRDHAQAANFAKSQFLANMSHEIRTPLNAVLGITQLLEQTKLSAEQKRYLRMISSSGKSLLDILNDILDFSKIEAGRMELALSTFRLDELLHSLATIMSVNAGDKNLELAIGVEPDVPQMLIGDAHRLQQVLVNLVTNAIKFTEQGEVSVLVKCIAQQPGTATLCFIVRDTGIGMTQLQQDRLFSPFTQSDASITRKFGGTGLGLSISRRLVDLMEGKIEMRSALEVGSEFSVTLTLMLADEKIPHTGSEVAANKLGVLRLLVVDDNKTTRDYLSKTIHAWHWDVESVASGALALKRIGDVHANGEFYDAVLMDWQMPDLDGLETLQAMRKLQPALATPIIMMVNTFGHNKLLEAENSTAPTILPDAYLFKPVTASSLFDSLHDLLSQGDSDLNTSSETSVLDTRTRIHGHLLLVEDNNFNQIVAKGLLEHSGATVDIVDNGKKAVDLLQAKTQAYDLILMDVQMPVMDGFTATKVIRNELLLTLPIIAMTAGVTEFEREQCIASGMNDLIAKPIDVEKMLATINRYLSSTENSAVALSAPKPAAQVQSNTLDSNNKNKTSQDKNKGSLDIFNVQQLFSPVAGDATRTKKMVELIFKLVDNFNQNVGKVRQMWRQGQQKEMAGLLHTMRGSIGMLGAKRFIAVAHELEVLLPDNDTPQIEMLIAQVEEELKLLISTAQQWLAGQSTLVEDNIITLIRVEQLDYLMQLLREQNMAALDLYNNLQPALDKYLSPDSSAALNNAMNHLDFTKALIWIELVAKTLK